MSKHIKIRKIDKREAQRRTNQHKRDFATLHKGWHRLGRDVAESVDLGVPAKLGKTMRQWLDDTFEQSASHIFAQLKSYRALKDVPAEALEAMPAGNAAQLTRLPEKDRKDATIVRKAVSQPPKEFRDTVDTIREVKYGITKDEWRTWAVRVPLSVYERLQAAQTKMARVLQLDIEDDTVRTKNLITVWEVAAQLINDTEEAWLVIETTGGGPLEELATRRNGTSNSPNSGANSGSTETAPPTLTGTEKSTSPEQTSELDEWKSTNGTSDTV